MIKSSALIAFSLLLFYNPVEAMAEQKNPPTTVFVDDATGLKYPSKLGPLDFSDVVEYPKKSLGYCARYTAPRDYGQLCVYDSGKKNLQTGIDSEEFKSEFNRAADATLAYLAALPYHDGKALAEATPSIGSDEKLAEAKMTIFSSKLTMPDGSDQDSAHMVLMTTGLGKFVKFNYTAKNMSSADFAERSRDVVEAFVRFNGETMKAFLVDRKGKQQ
jgi:hypothetical protein